MAKTTMPFGERGADGCSGVGTATAAVAAWLSDSGIRQADLRIQPGGPPRILASAELILLRQRERKLERPPVHGREVRRVRDRHDGAVRDSLVQRNLA